MDWYDDHDDDESEDWSDSSDPEDAPSEGAILRRNFVLSPHDREDYELFEEQRDPRIPDRGTSIMVLRIKNDDPQVTSYSVCENDWFDSLWTRFGAFLARNTHLRELSLHYCDLRTYRDQMEGLCAGLQENRGLREITIKSSGLTRSDVDILSDAISNRSADVLEFLDLRGNNFGDVDLDDLCRALGGKRNFKKIYLNENGIGARGCRSIAALLRNRESNLEVIDLGNNVNMSDDAVVVLAEALANNDKLQRLYLNDNHRVVTGTGWSALLQLVLDDSSIDGMLRSNHTLENLGVSAHFGLDRDAIVRALGADGANRLNVALRTNGLAPNKTTVARHKILWSHAGGRLNVGDAAIAPGVMPQVLGLFADVSADETIGTIRGNYRLPSCWIDIVVMRLDSVYRILRSMPHICQKNSGERS